MKFSDTGEEGSKQATFYNCPTLLPVEFPDHGTEGNGGKTMWLSYNKEKDWKV